MWKEEAGNEIMNGVQVSYLSQAERHKGCKLSATRNELPICEKSDCSILFDLALLSSLKKMSALLLLLLWAFINPETFFSPKKKKRGGGVETCFTSIQGATLKNKCYVIKRGLLNRSVYLYGNNDRLKTLSSIACRTRKGICMQLLCEHDSPNDLVKLPCSKKWVGYFSGFPLCTIHFPFSFRIEKKASLVFHIFHDLVWNWYDLQITVGNLLKKCCYSDLNLCHMTLEFLFIHENIKQHSSSEIKRTIKQNTQILHRINKKMEMQNWKAPAFLALSHLSFTHNRLSHNLQGRSIFAVVWFFCCGTSRPPSYIVSDTTGCHINLIH